jgi:predicted HD superfamily hydrolase involved in NAD metabolism
MTLDGVAFVRIARGVRAAINSPARYAHVLRVARFSERLAFDHGADPLRARLAGLLHDLARLYSTQRLLSDCAARTMPIDAFERANPIVLHAPLGAELAREYFGITDASILSAIAKHTVAAREMSTLDKIVYLADTLEPGRDFTDRAELAALARHDLDAAMDATLRSHIAHMHAQGAQVAPQTLAAAQFYTARSLREKRSA